VLDHTTQTATVSRNEFVTRNVLNMEFLIGDGSPQKPCLIAVCVITGLPSCR